MTEIDWNEVYDIVLRGLVGGAISFIARKLFAGSQEDLKELQNRPPEKTDREREELLAHYVEELTEQISDPNEPTVKESMMIIKSRAGVFAAYLHLKVQRISSEGETPKGT